MILRRIAEAIKRQDWFTVLVEVLIVVFGVFIGIQVANWNEDRKTRTEEQRFIAQLLKEINSEIEEKSIGSPSPTPESDFWNPDLPRFNPNRLTPSCPIFSAGRLHSLTSSSFAHLCCPLWTNSRLQAVLVCYQIRKHATP